jgi:hypothetical protein
VCSEKILSNITPDQHVVIFTFTNLNMLTGFDPPPARVFAWRVMELKKQGVGEDEAIAAADVLYYILKNPFFTWGSN